MMNENSQGPNLVDVAAVSQELRIRPQIYVKLVKSFCLSLSGKMQRLDDAIVANDRDQMRMILHEIKGTAGNLRLQNIMGPEAILHVAVKAGDPQKTLMAHYAILQAEVQRLQQYVNQLSDGSEGRDA